MNLKRINLQHERRVMEHSLGRIRKLAEINRKEQKKKNKNRSTRNQQHYLSGSRRGRPKNLSLPEGFGKKKKKMKNEAVSSPNW